LAQDDAPGSITPLAFPSTLDDMLPATLPSAYLHGRMPLWVPPLAWWSLLSDRGVCLERACVFRALWGAGIVSRKHLPADGEVAALASSI